MTLRKQAEAGEGEGCEEMSCCDGMDVEVDIRQGYRAACECACGLGTARKAMKLRTIANGMECSEAGELGEPASPLAVLFLPVLTRSNRFNPGNCRRIAHCTARRRVAITHWNCVLCPTYSFDCVCDSTTPTIDQPPPVALLLQRSLQSFSLCGDVKIVLAQADDEASILRLRLDGPAPFRFPLASVFSPLETVECLPGSRTRQGVERQDAKWLSPAWRE